MQDNEKKPALRFKGFTDPWEQRKLGDITVELSEYATQELGLPLLTSSRSGLIYQDEYRDSRTTKSTETLFSVVPVGTCTYRHMSDDDVFHMNINTLEKGLVSREYPVFEASKGNNLEFLVQHINSSEEFKAFCAEQKKGGTRTRLYYNTLCQFTVRVPALKEQAQISQCLKKLDTLITLHQRKYEKLVNIKKSMLDKMFPKNGASVPEIRFKGFTDPWEQRKLEEYLEVSGQKNFEGIYTKEDVLSVSGDFGIVNQIEFQGRSFAGASVANYGVVETGDIVYTKSPLKSNPYGIIKANKGKNGIVSTLYAVYKPKQSANPEFVQIYFEQDARMNNYMHPLVNKGAKNDMKVSAENALKGQIVFPDIKEQRTISEFFRNLDTLITLHQREHIKPILEVKRVKRNE